MRILPAPSGPWTTVDPAGSTDRKGKEEGLGNKTVFARVGPSVCPPTDERVPLSGSWFYLDPEGRTSSATSPA